MTLRRDFKLSDQDERFLQSYKLPWETVRDGSSWVLIHEFAAPKGYNEQKVTAAIRMETGYPHSELDMVYFFPGLSLLDGRPIGGADVLQSIDGKLYQRWSRHRTCQNAWKPGDDSLETHVYLVEDWLDRELKK